AIMGCVLGLIGTLLGWLRQPALAHQQGGPVEGRALRVSPGMLFMLAGSLVIAIGSFLPPYPFHAGQISLFDHLQQGNGYLFYWPAPLAALALFACSLLALTGRKGAYLGGVSGTLVGLSFEIGLLVDDHGIITWLMGLGYVLGIIGAVL